MSVKISIILIFLSCAVNGISQQEQMHILGPMMGPCDSVFTKTYNTKEHSVIYYPTEDTALFISYCFSEDWCSGFKIHDSIGKVHFYFGATKDDDYSTPFLHRALWAEDQLLSYEILGPGEFYQSFDHDKDGNIRIIDRTEDCAGYVEEMDSSYQTTAKGAYDVELATINWVHYHNNGLLKEKYTHFWPRGEMKVGPYAKYDDSGDIIIEGQFLDYEEIKTHGLDEKDSKGYKDGIWREYQNGKLVKEEIWENGKLKKP